ncbi:stress-responsive nuclear envelope protein [Acinetobacter haemolyticus]|uniref:stress-responsive nuclear envelope protein n=1 Tax=Acinetobacter haemolyticus TaxID=29430 RepID=UPI003AF92B79
MKIIYARKSTGITEKGTFHNPDYYEKPNANAKHVSIYGDFPKIKSDYEALGVSVDVHNVSTTLATVNLIVGVTPELQAALDEAKEECVKVASENTELKQKLAIFEQSNEQQSELISENSRLKDALTIAEDQIVNVKGELIAFKNDIDAMKARIVELEAGQGIPDPLDEPTINDYESWTVDQIKAFLADKNIGFKSSASKPELLKLIPKE